jgi:alpha/beta superfamily hydrolase
MLAYDLLEREGPGATAVLLHPHPDYGGNRYHPVIDALYRGLPVSTLRFDFGSSDFGAAATDVSEAIGLAPTDAVVLIGYSFGAAVALMVDDPAVLGWFLVAPPLRWTSPAALAAGRDARPKHVLVPEFDQYSPPALTSEIVAGWPSTTMARLPGRDHFLMGGSEAVLGAAVDWIPSVLGHGA